MHGEYHSMQATVETVLETPPYARGILVIGNSIDVWLGNTPVCTGNTFSIFRSPIRI